MVQFCMIKTLTKETVYFFAILVVLALIQHPDFLHSPLIRVDNIMENKNFLHPFLWSLGLYLIIGIIRIILKFMLNLKKRFNKK